ncbi:hypothetical protein P43SY_011891 [Pythium insidiosum]|uniref:Anoctamin transmembrane domain-containing protein n=1 Tax=Pythium insidiosum TaxID=114742 RepID=A0AAD5Q207_PYTIN|nr:hypothetical protein P43SY_011891 [Pythium insidiosum]
MAIIEHIITNQSHGAGYDLEKLLYDGVIADCYPLHDEEEKMELKERWIRWDKGPMEQPFQRIWNYFGVKVALYFLYLGHSTKWLLYPAIVGLFPALLGLFVPEIRSKEVFSTGSA